jgi:hypothetical protein
MIAIVSASDSNAVISRLEQVGEKAQVIGQITVGTRGCTVSGPAGTWGSAEAWTATHDA